MRVKFIAALRPGQSKKNSPCMALALNSDLLDSYLLRVPQGTRSKYESKRSLGQSFFFKCSGFCVACEASCKAAHSLIGIALSGVCMSVCLSGSHTFLG